MGDKSLGPFFSILLEAQRRYLQFVFSGSRLVAASAGTRIASMAGALVSNRIAGIQRRPGFV